MSVHQTCLGPLSSGKEEEDEHEEQNGDFLRSMEFLDELGKTTLESEEVCHTLIGELNQQLKECPDSPPLLWRLARALVHLSMHCEQKGRGDEEKQLLVNGE